MTGSIRILAADSPPPSLVALDIPPLVFVFIPPMLISPPSLVISSSLGFAGFNHSISGFPRMAVAKMDGYGAFKKENEEDEWTIVVEKQLVSWNK